MIQQYPLLPTPYSRLDAVAHGGFPQDRAASLLPTPCFKIKLEGYLVETSYPKIAEDRKTTPTEQIPKPKIRISGKG
ncbi:MAG: hypothetical protein F6J98_00535 [Moorea sp. SIO4G2]|nr:hypothetical protein [Moorena sp. SIO4G2]